MSGVPENGWYAVLDGEQSGPMELSVLLGAVGEGRANDSTFVWRPGYPEWKRAGDVEGLAELFAASGQEEGGPTTVTGASEEASVPAGGFSDDIRNTVAVDMEAVVRAAQVQKSGEPSEAADDSPSSSMDALFGDDPSPASDGDSGGGFFDVPESAKEDEKVMLYQRRDTSVLFSLDDFGKGGAGGGDNKKEVFAERTAESGLIDIRAVARKTSAPAAGGGELFESTTVSPAASRDFATRMDTRTEPLIVTRRKRGIPVWAVVVGGLCVATLGAVGALMIGGGGETPPEGVAPAVVEAEPPTPVQAKAAEDLKEEAKPEAQSQAKEKASKEPAVVEAAIEKAPAIEGEAAGADVAEAAGPDEVEKAQVAEKKEEAKTVAKAEPPVAKKAPPKKQTPKKKAQKPAASKKKPVAKAKPAPAKKEPKKAPAPKPAPSQPKSSEANQATALLNSLGGGGGGGGGGGAKASSGNDSGLPKKLSKSNIRKAVRKHTKAVVACYNNAGQPGGTGPVIVTARLNVAASGSVSSVTVLGALGSGAVGSCISSKLKTAKFPPFQNGPQTVPMTFRVK